MSVGGFVLALFSALNYRLRDLCVRATQRLSENAISREVWLKWPDLPVMPETQETCPLDRDCSVVDFDLTAAIAEEGPYPRSARLSGIDCEDVHAHVFEDRPARARRQGPLRTAVLKSAKNISIALLFASLCSAQGFLQLYQLTTTGKSIAFNNINPNYNSWTVMYNYSGSGNFSIELDCAADATVAGGTPTPGSFTACSNTVTGTNPSTQTGGNYGYITFLGFTPWVQLNVTVLASGNITVAAFGYNPGATSSASSGGCAGTVGTPCIVAGPNGAGSAPTKNPVLAAGEDGTDVRVLLTDASGHLIPVIQGYNGAATPVIVGTSQAAVSVTTGTDVVLVSGTSGKTTYLTLLGFAWDNAATATIRQGTTSSTPCDTSTATISGPWGNANLTALFEDYGANFAPLKTSSTGLDICLHFSTSVTGGGEVRDSQF
jgi:hypothetical protein